jgi:acetyl-CoA acetyltransferase
MKLQPVAIIGVGFSKFARMLDDSGADIAVAACEEALGDAGLEAGAVDGITTYLGAYEHAPLSEVVPRLGLDPERLRLENDVMALAPAAVTAVVDAVDAVKRGQCHTVLAYKANKWTRGKPPGPPTNQPRIGGPQQFELPYGNTMTAQTLAMWAMRHFHQSGTRHEHLGAIAVTNRRHAGRNPRAVLRDAITLDDYLASPWVSEPFRRLDCDFPIDGAGALVVTTVERARDARQKPIYVLGGNYREAVWEEWESWPDLTDMASKPVCDRLWKEVPLTPKDVDVAGLYDGFSYLELCWLEDAGFCKKGEGGPFVASGAIDLGGELPTNTHGGNLSEGRSHGVGHILEVVQQLRGTCGPRQVEGARVGFAGNGGGPIAGAVLMANDLP